MADSKKIAGTVYIKVDGEQLSVSGSVEFPLSTFSRESKIGSTGVVGYSQTDRVPFIKCECLLTNGFPVDKLTTSDDMTITAELATGWVSTLSGAWLTGDIDGNSTDGVIGVLQTN